MLLFGIRSHRIERCDQTKQPSSACSCSCSHFPVPRKKWKLEIRCSYLELPTCGDRRKQFNLFSFFFSRSGWLKMLLLLLNYNFRFKFVYVDIFCCRFSSNNILLSSVSSPNERSSSVLCVTVVECEPECSWTQLAMSNGQRDNRRRTAHRKGE